jgi:hypothetical protein
MAVFERMVFVATEKLTDTARRPGELLEFSLRFLSTGGNGGDGFRCNRKIDRYRPSAGGIS